MYRTLQNTHIYSHAHVSKLKKEEEKNHVFRKGAALRQRVELGVWNCAFQLSALLPGTMLSSIITPELAFHLRVTGENKSDNNPDCLLWVLSSTPVMGQAFNIFHPRIFSGYSHVNIF